MPLPKNRVGNKKKKRNPAPRCAVCAVELNTSASPKLSRTQRSPSRTLGASLCHSCLREIVSMAARVSAKEMRIADVDQTHRRFVEKIAGAKQ